MRSRSALLVLLFALSVGARALDPDPPDRREEVKPGMTVKQVRHLLGDPVHKPRQIIYQGVHEQWVYERPNPCRIDFVLKSGSEQSVQSRHIPPRRKP